MIQRNKTSSIILKLSNMASLVADYGSDSSAASEEDEDPGPGDQHHGGSGGKHNVDYKNSTQPATDNPERNYFLPVESEEEEDEDDAMEDVGSSKRSPSRDFQQQSAVKLPKPNFDSNSPARPSGTDGGISVFANPYRAAEEARNSLLEKHVKMTPTGNNQQRSIMGKKVCWNYRKGRCRFGSTCKFAHDSDIAVIKQAVTVADGTAESDSFASQRQ